jgi:hypothetical protein
MNPEDLAVNGGARPRRPLRSGTGSRKSSA